VGDHRTGASAAGHHRSTVPRRARVEGEHGSCAFAAWAPALTGKVLRPDPTGPWETSCPAARSPHPARRFFWDGHRGTQATYEILGEPHSPQRPFRDIVIRLSWTPWERIGGGHDLRLAGGVGGLAGHRTIILVKVLVVCDAVPVTGVTAGNARSQQHPCRQTEQPHWS